MKQLYDDAQNIVKKDPAAKNIIHVILYIKVFIF